MMNAETMKAKFGTEAQAEHIIAEIEKLMESHEIQSGSDVRYYLRDTRYDANAKLRVKEHSELLGFTVNIKDHGTMFRRIEVSWEVQQ